MIFSLENKSMTIHANQLLTRTRFDRKEIEILNLLFLLSEKHLQIIFRCNQHDLLSFHSLTHSFEKKCSSSLLGSDSEKTFSLKIFKDSMKFASLKVIEMMKVVFPVDSTFIFSIKSLHPLKNTFTILFESLQVAHFYVNENISI